MDVQDEPDLEDPHLEPVGDEMHIDEAANQRHQSSKPAIPMRRRVILESDDESGDNDSHAAQAKRGAADMNCDADADTNEPRTQKGKALKVSMHRSPCALLHHIMMQKLIRHLSVLQNGSLSASRADKRSTGTKLFLQLLSLLHLRRIC